MKILTSEKIKKHYIVTLKVTDKDIEMLEDLAWCTDYDEKWCQRTFREFQKLWKKFDK